MEVFAQIWAWGGVFCFDPVVVTQIWRKINRSGEDPTMRWKFSFKFGLEVVFLASIPWLSHKSKEKSTDPTKIQQRFGEIRWRFGDFRWRFSEDLEVETHSDFNRPDRCPPEPDLTRPKVVGDRRRVVQPPTQCEQVGSGLGTNPTQTDPWTPLNVIISKLSS